MKILKENDIKNPLDILDKRNRNESRELDHLVKTTAKGATRQRYKYSM